MALVAGDYHTCTLLDEGGVMCWGMNKYGQLGIGKYVGMVMPTAVIEGEN